MQALLKQRNAVHVRKQEEPEMHPSGMTIERWNFPFKTEAERELVRRYLNPQVFDDSIPF